MEIVREVIEEELKNESKASFHAKKLGLEYMGFGRWGKNGKVTHRTLGDKVVPSRIFFDPGIDKAVATDNQTNNFTDDSDYDHLGPFARGHSKQNRQDTYDQDGPFARDENIEEELEIEENKARKPGDVWQRKNGLWSAKSQGHRIAHFANRRSAEDHAKKSDTKFHPDFGKSLVKKSKNESTKASTKTDKDKIKEEELKIEAEKHVHRYKKVGKSMYKQKCSCGKERVWKQGGSHGKVLWYYPSEKKSKWSY